MERMIDKIEANTNTKKNFLNNICRQFICTGILSYIVNRELKCTYKEIDTVKIGVIFHFII